MVRTSNFPDSMSIIVYQSSLSVSIDFNAIICLRCLGSCFTCHRNNYITFLTEMLHALATTRALVVTFD